MTAGLWMGKGVRCDECGFETGCGLFDVEAIRADFPDSFARSLRKAVGLS